MQVRDLPSLFPTDLGRTLRRLIPERQNAQSDSYIMNGVQFDANG